MPRDEGEGRVEDLFLRCTRTDSRRDGDLWRADYARLLLVKSLLVSADRGKSRVALSAKINGSTHASLVTCAISYGARKVAAIFFFLLIIFFGGRKESFRGKFRC